MYQFPRTPLAGDRLSEKGSSQTKPRREEAGPRLVQVDVVTLRLEAHLEMLMGMAASLIREAELLQGKRISPHMRPSHRKVFCASLSIRGPSTTVG